MSTEFGGGLGRFANNTQLVNKCREMVEVPGGSEWKIRKFQDEFEQFCWKYSGSSVIVNYHFKRLQTVDDAEDENQRMFYGKVSHFMSPLEISIQPKYLSSARKSIMEQLNTCYQHTNSVPDPFAEDQIFAPVACAVNELGIWYRGRIAQISGKQHVVVELVDFGTQILVPRHQVLPLLRRFGRAPPLCLKCRADGLTVNDLEVKDLHDFKDIVTSCNALFRVEIKSIEEPYLIDLYHPTIFGVNVCDKFKPPPDDEAKIDRIERSWLAHCRKINEEFEEDEDLEDFELGDGDYFPSVAAVTTSCHVTPRRFVRRLPKCQRAPRFERDVLIVDRVENSQLIYLQYPWQVERRAKLDQLLCDTWHELPELPDELRVPDQVCVIRNARKGGLVRRAVVVDRRTMLLLDYGKFVRCPEIADLRLLPAHGLCAEEPMLTIVSLQRAINMMWPHHSETLFLREKLPSGTRVHFKWDQKSKVTPMRGRLRESGKRDNLNDLMAKHMTQSRIDGRCNQLDIYRPRIIHMFHTPLPRRNFVYHATCHSHYSRGAEEFFSL